MYVPEDDEDFEFLQAVFRGFLRIHHTKQYLFDGESTFNSFFVCPLLEAVALSTLMNKYGAELKVGECALKAMSGQLRELKLEEDDKSQYKADGINKLFNSKEAELLLLETSGSYTDSDKVKINFDHHKGIFGWLAMLKTIADEYKYASVDVFKKLKHLFLARCRSKLALMEHLLL